MEQAIVELLINNGVSGILAVLIGLMLRSINQIKTEFITMRDAMNKKLYDPTTGRPHYRYAADCETRMADMEKDINAIGCKVDALQSSINNRSK